MFSRRVRREENVSAPQRERERLWTNVKEKKRMCFVDAGEIILEFVLRYSTNVIQFCFLFFWRKKKERLWEDFQTKHSSHSSSVIMGEIHKHWSLHVAESTIFQCYLSSLKLFSATYTLVYLPHDFYSNCLGGSWMYFVPFLKCCTVLSTYASQNPSLWFCTFPPSLHLWHLNLYMKFFPAPLLRSLWIGQCSMDLWRSTGNWHRTSLYRPCSFLHL